MFGVHLTVCVHVCVGCLTLDDSQEDYNDKEEESDVEDDPVDLILITSWILNQVTNSSTCSHSHIHVEHVTLGTERDTQEGGYRGNRGQIFCIGFLMGRIMTVTAV